MGAGSRTLVWICGLLLGAGLLRAQPVTVSQLDSFLDLATRLSMDDADMARRLGRFRLQMRAPEGFAERAGIAELGPRSQVALRRTLERARNKENPFPDGGVPERGLSENTAALADEEATLLERVRAYALGYAESIPNFTCVRESQHFTDKVGTGSWRGPRRLEEQLQIVDGDEDHKQLRLDGRPVRGRARIGGAWVFVSGEFGNLIRKLFHADTKAAFSLDRQYRPTEEGRVRFRFRVAQEDSSLRITARGRKVTVGYSGFIEADTKTGEIHRVRYGEDGLPEDFGMRGSEGTVEYGWVEIEGARYLLPVRATMYSYMPPNFTRNQMTYREYRKYDAASTIQFGEVAEGEDP